MTRSLADTPDETIVELIEVEQHMISDARRKADQLRGAAEEWEMREIDHHNKLRVLREEQARRKDDTP